MEQYHFLVILESEQRWSGKRQVRWARCRCICGNEKWINEGAVKSGHTISCGCKHVKHGHARNDGITAEWRAWWSMIQRCEDPDNPSWEHYGGRGIKVYPQWRFSFTTFLKYIGSKPDPKMSLDRYPNNDGNYEPGNVRWATASEQRRNMRPKQKCVNGHTFTDANTYSDPQHGHRQCRICRRDAGRRRDLRKKGG